jgi:Flp pilus assembly protein TadD
VKLEKQNASRYSLPGRVIALPARFVVLIPMVFIALMLGACASQQVDQLPLPPLQVFEPVEPAADIDILAVSPEMDEFLERYVLQYRNPKTRFNMLTLAVVSGGILDFYYNETRTLSAAEAFASRSGNCIGFANLMVALARKAGLTARYQEVKHMAEWSSRADTLLVVKHINVVISGPGFSYIVDVSGLNFENDASARLVSDAYAKTLFYNNIGAEALLKNELPTAWGYLAAATQFRSGASDPWSNLGVVYNRNGQVSDAETAYRAAMSINPRDYSAMNNLYELYLAEENLQEAEQLARKVDQYRRKNPYYLMKLGEIAAEEGDFETSFELIKTALKKKDDDALLYLALAKTQFLSGNTLAAQNSLGQARELAPEHELAHYNRPLDELVVESLLRSECLADRSCQ